MYLITLSRIRVSLGKGHCGTVARAIWYDSDGMIYEVAVKSLTRGTSGDERVKLLREAAIMGQFHHSNVLQLYGVVVRSEEVSHYNITLMPTSMLLYALMHLSMLGPTLPLPG